MKRTCVPQWNHRGVATYPNVSAALTPGVSVSLCPSRVICHPRESTTTLVAASFLTGAGDGSAMVCGRSRVGSFNEAHQALAAKAMILSVVRPSLSNRSTYLPIPALSSPNHAIRQGTHAKMCIYIAWIKAISCLNKGKPHYSI